MGKSKDLHINKRGVGWELSASRLGLLKPGETTLGTLLNSRLHGLERGSRRPCEEEKIFGCARSRIAR